MRTRVGIAGRTAALLLLVAFGVAGGTGWLLYEREARAEQRRLEDRASLLAAAVEGALQDVMGEHPPATLRPVIEAVARTEGVKGVALAGRTGRIALGAGERPARLDAPPAPRWSWSADRVTLTRAVPNDRSCRDCHDATESTNGALYVALDSSDLAPRLARSATGLATVAVLTLLAMLLATVAVLRVTLVRPLRALERFAEAVGRGDLDARPPPGGGPETAALAEALRRMAEEVQQTHRDLERRVADRTAELARALELAHAAEDERATAFGRLQAVIDSMADGVIFIDDQDRIALVNQAGRVLRNLRGGSGRPIKACHPRVSHGVLDRVLGYLRNGNDAGPPHSIIKEREGRFETTYAPVRDAEGTYLGTVMVIRDIAERRNLERRLLDTERLAGLGQMSAQVAHQLRNPLNTIGGAAQYLGRVLPGNPDVTEYAALIDEEVRRVNRFIDDLLNVARPADPVFSPTSVNKLVKEAAQRAAVARGLPPESVRLTLARDLPPLDLDAKMILEALLNLLDNAFDVAGDAPPELVSRFEGSDGEGAVAVEVLDRGPGIPVDQLEEVTRPFVTTKATGTGLGLVVVQRAVEQHRARFHLGPREGGGTAARILFPVRTLAPAAGQDAA